MPSLVRPVCSPQTRPPTRTPRAAPTAAGLWRFAGTSPPRKDPADKTLWLVDLKTGEGRDLLEGFDRWSENPVWALDAGAVFFAADDDGNVPVFRASLDGIVTCLTGVGAFSDPCPSPDGRLLSPLRSPIPAPPHPVAIDLGMANTEPRRLRSFEELDGFALRARIERVTATAEDGVPVRSWLLLPPE